MDPRPYPPVDLCRIIPAPELFAWVRMHLMTEGMPLYNPDHEHLHHLSWGQVGFLWAPQAFAKGMHFVMGQCEQVMIAAGGWKRERQEQQLKEWFGEIPRFLITIAAGYVAECSDADFCALIEHELYHIAQALDGFGLPKFSRETGLPVLRLRGHDVEEFHGVVRRYGANDSVDTMAKLARQEPEVARADIAQACGTCLLRLA